MSQPINWKILAEDGNARASGPVLYCPRVDSRLHGWLMSKLS